MNFVLNIQAKTAFMSGLENNYGQTYAELIYTHYGIAPEFRSYNRDSTQGMFIGFLTPIMLVSKKYYHDSSLSESDYGSFIGAGIKLGYKFRIAEKFILEPSGNIGLGIYGGLKKDIDYANFLSVPKRNSVFFGINIIFGIYLNGN